MIELSKKKGWKTRLRGTVNQVGTKFPTGRSPPEMPSEPMVTLRPVRQKQLSPKGYDSLKKKYDLTDKDVDTLLAIAEGDELDQYSLMRTAKLENQGLVQKTEGKAYDKYHLTPSGKLLVDKLYPVRTSILSKHNPWGRYAQRDIKREKDLLPEVNEDVDTGWLATWEKSMYNQFDAEEREKIRRLIDEAKGGDASQSSLALTALEVEYPDIYEHLTGRQADAKNEEPSLV